MKSKKLYKKTSVGDLQYWQIEVKGAEIITYYGKVGGTEMETHDVVREAKSQDTIEKQAVSEAESQFKAKVKKGYVLEIDRAQGGETNHTGGWFPMLAHKFRDHGHKIVYPAYVQPKLDGYRCVSDPDQTLWTRTRKPHLGVPHIAAALPEGVRLDGELYNHKYKDNFERISHLVNQKLEAADGHEVVQYHVYDVNMPGSFEERHTWLRANLPKGLPFVLVETKKVNDEDELMEAFEYYRSKGYEGAMVRNAAAPYEMKRSYNLLKIKEFDDAEFKIVGIEEGRGRLMGHVGAFICETSNGTRFNAKMIGETSKLKEYFDNYKLWEGKSLTVQYQGLTTKNKVPRFPRGIRFRED
jgi:ATP-dependent DNA ligase